MAVLTSGERPAANWRPRARVLCRRNFNEQRLRALADRLREPLR
jgi:hypothetical protein